MTRIEFTDLFKQAVKQCAPLRQDVGDPALPTKRKFEINPRENAENPLFREYLGNYLAHGNTVLNSAPTIGRFWFGGTPAEEITLTLVEVKGCTAFVKVSITAANTTYDEAPRFNIAS